MNIEIKDFEEFGITPFLYMVAHRCNQLQDEYLKKFNVSGKQAAVLGVIEFLGDGAINQKRLGETLGVKESSVSSIVKTMIKNELIKKAQSSEDARNYIITITEKGKKICDQFKNSIAEFEKTFYSNLSEDERKSFKKLLIKLI